MYIEHIIEQIEETTEKLEKLTEKYNKLGEERTVKLYNETEQAIKALKCDLKKLEKEYRIQQMATCDHILSKRTTDRHYGSFEHCAKCGLNTRVRIKRGYCLTQDDLLMLEAIKMGAAYHVGNRPYPNAPYVLVKAVYNRILEEHPYIDSKTAAKYIGIALENMLDIKENSAREKTIRKHLKLEDDYNYKSVIGME